MPIATSRATFAPVNAPFVFFRTQACVGRLQQQVGEQRAGEDEQRAAEGRRRVLCGLEPLEHRLDDEKEQEADRHRHQEPEPAPADRPEEGQPEQAEHHRDDPDVRAEQCHQAVEGERRLGRLDGRFDVRRDRRPRREQEGDLVRLSADPGVREDSFPDSR